MTEVRTSSLCERPCAGIEDTLEASIGTGGPQSVFDAAMAPTQESGLRENCTSRLSERAEAGRTLHLSRLYSNEAGEQSEGSLLRRRLRGRTQRSRWSEGRGPRGIRTSTTRTGLRARLACQTRWSVYGNFRRPTPAAGAACGKAPRTRLGGGRAMKRPSLRLLRRGDFLTLLGDAAAWRRGLGRPPPGVTIKRTRARPQSARRNAPRTDPN